ncbi:serine protease 28-like [Cimex lectularius]|uniref:Peptidase S1 domain-containing protein n=1 Tax=Cimex lectularius TaxID=79782 RepID=A0A8I6SDK9_CIMLE|nr:serine protease 28-like [Cimex lectularius]
MFGGKVIFNNANFTYVVMVVNSLINQIKLCTGVVVGPTIAITAAHCILEKVEDAVVPGNVTLYTQKDFKRYLKMTASRIFVHPNYTIDETSDIAVVHVKKTFDATILPMADSPFDGPEYCLLAGYGMRGQHTKGIPQLSVISNVETFDKKACKHVSKIGNVVCVPSYGPVGPCTGDSGGPLVCNNVLRAILSRGVTLGEGCGTKVFSIMMYEDFYEHKDWLIEKSRSLGISGTPSEETETSQDTSSQGYSSNSPQTFYILLTTLLFGAF